MRAEPSETIPQGGATLKRKTISTACLFLANARSLLAKEQLPHIVKCLQQLSDGEIWWRPNQVSNSAGNLVLHLCGNVRQWIISGLGGGEDHRERDLEFSERGPIPRAELIARLRQTVREACAVLERLSETSLSQKYVIQGYHVTKLEAVFHVVEHFGYHTGQIIFITKLKRARDLKFTRLPKIKKKAAA